MVYRNPNHGPIVIKHNGVSPGRNSQSAGLKAGCKIDIRLGDGRINPLPALVKINLQSVHIKFEIIPVNIQRIGPLHLHGIKCGDHGIRISSQGGIHHHQAQINIIQGDADGIGIGRFSFVKNTIIVLIDKVGPKAHENVHIRGTQNSAVYGKIFDTGMIFTESFDLFQTGTKR